ncbi:diguanylate cyclase domain-containing protein [Shewanella salipaludis]|uniref:Diguanylate cyclase n=1 Tax=Shewanella salipaludis TaxID=2723052 RepID=A0A972FYT2_9GAMM|nr:diguanylate cyclase [Shewanella salipaludis]NMH65147.1 diguanylate cyclase [Shewanella salipaludis]
MFRDETIEPLTCEAERLHKRIRRLKRLAGKYKRAEIIQNALLEISNIAAKASSPEDFYAGVHKHLQKLIPADNFFISTLNPHTGQLEIPFFADEKDAHPAQLFSEESLSATLHQGLTGYVFRTGRPLLCDEDKFNLLLAAEEIVSLGSACHQWLGVPIFENEAVSGVLVVQSYDTQKTYGEIELELMAFICHHIAGVQERLRHQEHLEQAITQRTKELSLAYDKLKQEVHERRRAERLQRSLFEIAALATSRIDSLEFYAQLHHVLSHLLPANNCYIALLDEDKTQLTFPFYVSQLGLSAPGSRPVSDGLAEYVLKHKRPLKLEQQDIQALIAAGELYAESPDLNQTQDMHQWIGIPLFIHEQVRGALTIYSFTPTQTYQVKDLELLTFVSQHIGAAIERKLSAESLQRSYQELEEKVTARTQALAALNQNLVKEINQRRKVEAQLTHDAKHDTLTSLPNRAMFMERLNQAIKHVRRHGLDRFALLFIDLDRFKLINDTLGHVEGDRFLIETAKRLKACIRDNDTLARLGGDEFVVLLDSIHSAADTEEVAERILSALSQPYRLGNQSFGSSASIGIALSSNGNRRSDTSESMLSDADAAMYQAKSKGKGCYVIFDDESHQELLHEVALENELRQAIAEDKLQLSYLPIFDMPSGTVTAIEPRLFWQHPRLGKLKQARLKDIAEQCNMIIELDKYMLILLAREYPVLQAHLGYEPQLHLAISSQHLKHKHALRSLKNTLKQCGLPLSKLLLFFNELALVQDTQTHINAFEFLKKLELKLGINGYGSGYSASHNLLFLPIDALKLDANITTHLTGEHQIKLLKIYWQTAKTLDLKIYADGISCEQQQRQLTELGYNQGQGPLLGKVFSLPAQAQQVCA